MALVLPELIAVPVTTASGPDPVLKLVYPLAALTGLSLLLTPAVLALRRRRFGWCFLFAVLAAVLGTLTIYGAVVVPGAAVLAAAAPIGALRQGLTGGLPRPQGWAELPLKRRVAETARAGIGRPVVTSELAAWASWKSCYLTYRLLGAVVLTAVVVLPAAVVHPLFLLFLPLPMLVLLWLLADWSAVAMVQQSAEMRTSVDD